MNRTAVLDPASPLVRALGSAQPPSRDAFRSVEECAAEAVRLAYEVKEVDKDGDTLPVKLYDRLYEKHLGCRPYHRSASGEARVLTMMNSVMRYCRDNGLDLEVYIAAQMVTLRPFVCAMKYGFQPNMLLGKNAIARYNSFARKLDKSFHRVREDVIGADEGKLRDTLLQDELAVGALYCGNVLQRGNLKDASSFEHTAIAVGPSPQWQAVRFSIEDGDRRVPIERAELRNRYGPDRLERFAYASICLAASIVCDRLHLGLASRLAVRAGAKVTWEGLAAALLASAPSREPRVEASRPVRNRPTGEFWTPGLTGGRAMR